ncbi:hypothetical protein [Tenacibaculum aquimarinum]|uniref:hypothetical protein n=1 Tax=Tenacibaculum aquimarinum TaxID=2910675 RepID=UPI001F0B5B66|nr:hypothetical protein [Tenacibaculum aquimarinum]MCH3885114.1 hypothetical protein [Tenacibaculum aquimarinum]
MKYLTSLFLLFLLISCSNKNSELSNHFSCDNTTLETELKKVKDIRNLFSVALPKHWKTNLYYDNAQTSIFAADTTKSLTKSVLLDITLVHNPVTFDEIFINKAIASSNEIGLKDEVLKEIHFLDKPSFLQHSKGKKNNYSYEVVNVFSKVNSDNFLLTKIEVYGDSAVSKRLCNAISLVNNIQLK